MPNRSQAPASTPSFSFNIPQAQSELIGFTPLHIIQAGKQPVVKLEILFRSGGSINDRRKGQAFLTNKMLLHGTSSLSTTEISERLDAFGAFVRLVPSFDDPALEVFCLTKHLENILPVISDILQDAVFPDDEFALVQQITLENLQVQNSKNNVVASKSFRHKLFGENHPYGKVLQEKDIADLVPEDLRSFYGSNLRNFEIIATGNLSEEDLNLIRSQLCFGQSVESSFPSLSPKSELGEYYQEKTDSLQTSLRIGRRMPHKSDPDYIPLRVCLHALGGYFGSRLMKNIREDKGYTYGIYASLVALIHDTYLTIGADVQKATREDALSEIYKEIKLLQETPLGKTELTMVKNHLLGSFQSELDSPLALSSKFKAVYYFGLDYTYYDRFVATVKDLSAEDIRAMAQKYLIPSTFTEVSVG